MSTMLEREESSSSVTPVNTREIPVGCGSPPLCQEREAQADANYVDNYPSSSFLTPCHCRLE